MKKGTAEDRHRQKVPQYGGTPGWLLLTHSETGRPLALFVDKSDTPNSIPLVIDERMCSDTVLRVTQLKPNVLLACDIHTLNGTKVHAKLSYAARRALLSSLLDAFHQPELTAILSYDEVPTDTLIRGWEVYDDEPGTVGVFLPVKE